MSAGSIRAGKAHYELGIRDNTRRDIEAAESRLRKFADRMQSLGRNLAIGGTVASGIGLAMLAPLRQATEEAGNFEETLNRFDVTFKDMAKSTRDWAKGFAEASNRFEGDILNALSSYQGLALGVGFDNAEAAKLSKIIAQLTEDFGSLNNLNSDISRTKILGGLAGETQGLSEFGINVRVAAVDQEFLRQGLDATNKTATEQQKFLARLGIIYQSLGKQGAVGDAIRTANSYVNTQRGVEAGFRSLSVAIGSAVLPLRTEWNIGLIESLKTAEAFVEQNEDLVRSYAQVAAAIAVGGVAFVGVGTGILGASAAINTLADTSRNAAKPVESLGSTAQAAGGTATAGASGAARAFSFLGNTIGKTLAAAGSLAIVLGGAAKGIATLVGLIGVVPALAIGAAAGFVAIRLSADFEGTVGDISALISIMVSLASIAVFAGKTINDALEFAGINEANSALLKLVDTLLKVVTLRERLADLNFKDLTQQADKALDSPLVRLPGPALALVPAARAARDILKLGQGPQDSASRQSTAATPPGDVKEAAEQIKDEFTKSLKGLGIENSLDYVKDLFADITTNKAGDIQALGEGTAKNIQAKLEQQFSKIKIDDFSTNARDTYEKMLKGIQDSFGLELKNGVFQDTTKNLAAFLQQAQKRAEEQAKDIDKKTSGKAIRAQGTFFAGEAASLFGSTQNKVVSKLEQVRKVNEQIRDAVKESPQLRFG